MRISAQNARSTETGKMESRAIGSAKTIDRHINNIATSSLLSKPIEWAQKITDVAMKGGVGKVLDKVLDDKEGIRVSVDIEGERYTGIKYPNKK